MDPFVVRDLGCGFGPLLIFLIALGVAGTVFWIWALVDVIRNPTLDDSTRIVWVLVILCTHLLGAILYFLIGRSAPTRSPG
jgi:uncharacterized RDD family membrane protein YckC